MAVLCHCLNSILDCEWHTQKALFVGSESNPMSAVKNILIAVDFASGAPSALEQAARLAGLNAAKLHVLYVVNSSAQTPVNRVHSSSPEQSVDEAARQARAILTNWMAQSGVTLEWELTVATGSPVQAIIERACDLRSDLLVAGLPNSTGVKSNTEAMTLALSLAREAETQVLLVSDDHPNAFHQIVACIDFSDVSYEVAAQAQRVAIQDEAKVDFLHVWQEPWLQAPYSYAASGSAPSLDFGVKYQQALRRTLSEFVSDADEHIDSNKVLIHASNRASAIATCAMEAEADLIVVGGKGQSNLEYVLLGSTATQLVTRHPCSVLVVKTLGTHPESLAA
jgi:nucleotide-binding universal stress UspA family protein